MTRGSVYFAGVDDTNHAGYAYVCRKQIRFVSKKNFKSVLCREKNIFFENNSMGGMGVGEDGERPTTYNPLEPGTR